MKQAHTRRLWIYGALMLAFMALIFFMSAQPADESAEMSNGLLDTFIGDIFRFLFPQADDSTLDHYIRKTAHMTEYACLAVISSLFFRELLRDTGVKQPLLFLLPVLWSGLYAATDEWHQTFVPGRSGELRDVCIDTLGALLGVSILFLAASLFPRRRVKENRSDFSSHWESSEGERL